jgi:hypothetical protein
MWPGSWSLRCSIPPLSRTVLAVGGPENLSLNQVVAQIEQAANRKAAVRHVPVPLMRLSSLVLGPLKPDLSGLIQAGIAFDTVDMTFDAAELQRRFPQVELTRMADIVSQRFAVSPPARL